MLDIFIRTTISFVTLYTLCRLLNKKLIAQMTFFDFVAAITIGSIVASSIVTKDNPIEMGMLGLLIFCIYTFLSSLWAIKSLWGRKILEDEATHLINNGQLLEQGLKKVRLTVDGLLTNLRKKGYFYLDQIEVAVMETDGTISVLAKPPYLPVTQKDIEHIQASRGFAQTFIIDGQVLTKTLEDLGKDMNWVKDVLQTHSIPSIKEVFCAQIDQLQNIYIDRRRDAPTLQNGV